MKEAINGLTDFLTLRYHPGQEEYDNWWDWESGGARAVADMMCILRDELPEHTLKAANDAILYFIPDPWFLRIDSLENVSEEKKKIDLAKGWDPVPPPKTPSTGANRIDLCRSAICAGIATGNLDRIQHALAGLSETWQFVDNGDGFYTDGSFIQHIHTPYTGSYGDVLLTGLSMLFTLVSHTAFDVPLEDRTAIYSRVDDTFIPVIIEGQVLDNVRGRSVSRLTEPGSMHGASIMKSILLLAQGAPREYAERWKSICAGWITRNTYNQFDQDGEIPYLAVVIDCLSSKKIAPVDEVPRMFPSMDRLVHKTPHWVAALSLCSHRISWYECGNRENELASRTGSGMRYLYLLNEMGQFEDGFWPTLDYTAPVGTTVDSHPLLKKAAGEWGYHTPNNEWTGGLTQGKTSLAAMHLIGPDNTGLSARRTWIGTPEALIELVSDVKTSEKQALTVVEHRNLGETNQSDLWVDEIKISDTQEIKNPKSAFLSSLGGYVFLTPIDLEAKIEKREGSWIEINPARKSPGAEDKIIRHWATLHAKHKPKESTAWIIYPSIDKETLTRKIAAHGINVLQNDDKAQLVALNQAQQAWVIWRPGSYQAFTFNQPVIMLSEKVEDSLKITLSEPTQQLNTVTMTLPDKWETKHERVTLQHIGTKTQLTLDTTGLAGSAIHINLTKV